MWTHLLCWCMIIKGLFANRSHRNLTKGVKFFKTACLLALILKNASGVIPPLPKKKINCNSNKIKTCIY